uniref:Uncharacterized protein n=1 Tax=Tanacetum cinerariifolium TaxID=118510 RepID=A0A699HAS2_TANCI|nr:hypothetical protein [Tanacetum cinerariifolium]
MSSLTHPTPSDVDEEYAFPSINILDYTSTLPNYFPATPRNISSDFLKNSKNDEIPPVFLTFYNNPYQKDMQAFYAKESPISPPDPITPPIILTPSTVLPPSLLFDPRYFFVPEELLSPKKQIHPTSFSLTTLSNSSQKQAQVQTFDGISTCEYHHNQAISTSTNDFRFSSDASCSYSTNLNSMASTNAFQLAYNSYQDFEHPQATLQMNEPMEWTQDDISKEIEENLDEENMNQRSGLNMI